MAHRIDALVQQLPLTWIDGDPEIDHLVDNIRAIEGEWLIDPETRAAFSSIEQAD